jgi:hypothetical protein
MMCEKWNLNYLFFFFPRFSLHYTILFPLLFTSQLDLKFHILAIEFSLNYGLIFVKIN